jgi:hypothetical protein
MEISRFSWKTMTILNPTGQFIDLEVLHGVVSGFPLTIYVHSCWCEAQNLLDTELSAAQEEGLVVEMALGPNQGAGVPAPFDSNCLLWDLNRFDVSIPLGGNFCGVLLRWDSGPLVATSTGLVLNIANPSSGRSTIILSQSLSLKSHT